MSNIIDYVRSEMRTFVQKPFTGVDSLVLSQIAYFNLSGVVPNLYDDEAPVSIRDLFHAEHFDTLIGETFTPENNLALLTAVAASPRFRDFQLNYFINEIDSEIEMQFSAVTFLLGDDFVYIAYRGTDGTIVGWKEDFNMAFTYPLPAQEAGLLYMNVVSGYIPSSSTVCAGGHSKGGNIAIYASMKCHPSFRSRIVDIYNHDGPGFSMDVLNSADFQEIESRIRKTMPPASVFGMLLHQNENYFVIESTGLSGFVQHVPFNWIVEDGDFRYVEKLKSGAIHTQETINEWLFALSPDERKHFVDTIFQLVEATNAHLLTDLTDDLPKATLKFLAAAKDLDPDTKRFVQNAASSFFKASLRGLSPRAPRPILTNRTEKD